MHQFGTYIMYVGENYFLTLGIDGQAYRMRITKIDETDQLELYEITAGGKTVTLRNDRPLLILQESRKAIDWKVVAGMEHVTNLDNVLIVGRAIEGLWRRIWNQQNPWTDPKNEKKVAS